MVKCKTLSRFGTLSNFSAVWYIVRFREGLEFVVFGTITEFVEFGTLLEFAEFGTLSLFAIFGTMLDLEVWFFVSLTLVLGNI